MSAATLRDSSDRAVLRVIRCDKVSHFEQCEPLTESERPFGSLYSDDLQACRVACGCDGLCAPRTANLSLLASSDFLQTCDIFAGIKPIEVESSLAHGNKRLKKESLRREKDQPDSDAGHNGNEMGKWLCRNALVHSLRS